MGWNTNSNLPSNKWKANVNIQILKFQSYELPNIHNKKWIKIKKKAPVWLGYQHKTKHKTPKIEKKNF